MARRPLQDRVLLRRIEAEATSFVGDRAPFAKWSGMEIRVGGEELPMLKEADLMGIVEDAAVPAKHAA